MDYLLQDKVAVITGSSGGLGKDIALAFAEEGAHVVVTDINEIEGQRLTGEIQKIGRNANFYRMDVTKSQQINTVFDEIAVKLGGIDILVNCAGITKRIELLEFPEEIFDRIIAINLKGTFLCSQAAARQMSGRGGGKIVNIVSIGGMVGLPNTVAYCASKGGVVNMTRALAIDLAKYKINVNAVAPGLTNTPIAAQVFNDAKTFEWFISRIPMGRLCEPRDVSNAVLFLSSAVSDYLTGHVLAVEGGWLAE
jgi:NAD(P)-dependent dehydrogenase (short-subunit alcohol dehydrogenase family)